MKRRNLLGVFWGVLVSGCSKSVTFDTPSRKPERQFSAAPGIVSTALATQLAKNGFSILTADDSTVVGRKFESRLHGLFAPPPQGSSTETQYSFALTDLGGETRVIADAAIVATTSRGEQRTLPTAPNVIVEEMNAFLGSVTI